MRLEDVLPRLVERGFHFLTLESYPRFVGVERDNFVVLLEPAPEGLRLFGTAGYLVDGKIAVLVERAGRKIFQKKEEEIPATPEMLDAYHRFQEDLRVVLA